MKRWFALAVLLVACAPPETAPPAAPAPTPPPPPPARPIAAVETDSDRLRLTAYRLAGLAEAGESADATAGTWSHHAELMEGLWQLLDERHLAPMRAWADAELELAEPTAPLFYPFSGPDLPSALQFFPEASSYVLVGLELPGRIPDLDLVDAPDLDTELERLRGGLANLVESGYFVTKRMESDFVSPYLEGVLPLIYLFLARADLTPEKVQFIELDAEGGVVPMSEVTDQTARAVRIDFSTQGTPRTLYYFATDLSNPGLEEHPAFIAFLNQLGGFQTYMKSASYLLHMDAFTQLNELLVNRANTVLQDDSGIPLRDLSPEDFERRFFGTYTRTLPTYREWFQDDLRATFERIEADALPFAIGYNSKIGGSCLIWAQRR